MSLSWLIRDLKFKPPLDVHKHTASGQTKLTRSRVLSFNHHSKAISIPLSKFTGPSLLRLFPCARSLEAVSCAALCLVGCQELVYPIQIRSFPIFLWASLALRYVPVRPKIYDPNLNSPNDPHPGRSSMILHDLESNPTTPQPMCWIWVKIIIEGGRGSMIHRSSSSLFLVDKVILHA